MAATQLRKCSILVLFIVIPLITMIAIIVSMINRMKEIDRGEEDEAAKY